MALNALSSVMDKTRLDRVVSLLASSSLMLTRALASDSDTP